MSCEVHVRICESVGGKFPGATRLVIGIIGSKDDAMHIMKQVKEFVQNSLHLNIAEEKSGIHHARNGINFLGYEVRVYSGNKTKKMKINGTYTSMRTISEQIQLHVPRAKVRNFCQSKRYGDYDTLRPAHKPELLNRSDVEIILAYNAELRGLANYYCLAYCAKRSLGKLYFIWKQSLLRTLADKHKTSVNKLVKKLKIRNDFVYTYEVKGETKYLEFFSLKNMKKLSKNWKTVDISPNTFMFTLNNTEIVRRLNACMCEYCGKEEGDFEVHHVRKLADIQKGKELWQRVMTTMQRKTLVLCVECHQLLGTGKLPDSRYLKR